jgi:hypothetical protein
MQLPHPALPGPLRPDPGNTTAFPVMSVLCPYHPEIPKSLVPLLCQLSHFQIHDKDPGALTCEQGPLSISRWRGPSPDLTDVSHQAVYMIQATPLKLGSFD